MMTKEIIKLINLTKSYDKDTRPINNITVSMNKGAWTSIMGPSGSGKTTLLNLIGCLDSPTKGIIRINGTEITKLNRNQLTKFRRENIGLIFQQYHLVPYLTALENVMMAQYYHSVVDESEAVDALKRVGMGHRLKHVPAHLSGGEQQRVCIARALINEPDILLADEPTGNLDQKNGDIVLKLIKELRREGHTIVLVTHNPSIGRLGDRLIKLIDGEISEDSNC
ncbi:MAG: ABC transporter ATP-binding protein [Candidatus Heimdallarchaeota archaeon]|nr:ABC transporter ATP-binding protein [Candidatus Heimdallarchaeota archaeon]MCK4876909.1 ABC transporter ATP-binding protein [Candidatus Heimdallarchaeota archaeon]